MKDIIYFEINNKDENGYPPVPFSEWLNQFLLYQPNWYKENQLVGIATTTPLKYTDWIIGAPRSWIKENCPAILDSNFIIHPDEKGELHGRYMDPRPYSEENYGIAWYAM